MVSGFKTTNKFQYQLFNKLTVKSIVLTVVIRQICYYKKSNENKLQKGIIDFTKCV